MLHTHRTMDTQRRGNHISQLVATTCNFHFDCCGFCWVVLEGMIAQCSGKVPSGNDILQEKFQSCSDNHFYRIKSWPTSAQHISILTECCFMIPCRLNGCSSQAAGASRSLSWKEAGSGLDVHVCVFSDMFFRWALLPARVWSCWDSFASALTESRLWIQHSGAAWLMFGITLTLSECDWFVFVAGLAASLRIRWYLLPPSGIKHKRQTNSFLLHLLHLLHLHSCDWRFHRQTSSQS